MKFNTSPEHLDGQNSHLVVAIVAIYWQPFDQPIDKILPTFDLWKFSEFLSGSAEIRRRNEQINSCNLQFFFYIFLSHMT